MNSEDTWVLSLSHYWLSRLWVSMVFTQSPDDNGSIILLYCVLSVHDHLSISLTGNNADSWNNAVKWPHISFIKCSITILINTELDGVTLLLWIIFGKCCDRIWPWHRLSWMRAYVVFLHPSREMLGLYCFFKINYSSMKLPFDAEQYCQEASQNKPRNHNLYTQR